MQFDLKSNIYNEKGHLVNGIFVRNHSNFNEHIIAIAVQYRNNQMNGFYKTFNEYGRIVSDKTYLNGVLHGIATYFDDEGNIVREDYYDDGYKI